MIQSHFFTPSAALRPFVRQIVLRRAHVKHGVYIRPVGARTDVVLAFGLEREPVRAYEYKTSASRVMPRTLVIGPQTARQADLWLENNWGSLGVHFQPAGFLRLFHQPIAPLTDRAVDACDVIGDAVQTLHATLVKAASPALMVRHVERFLFARLLTADPEHATARAAAAMLETHGRLRIAEAIRQSGLSERQFERRFIEQMGMSPKLYARVARLNFVLSRKAEEPGTTWADISQEAGYFDQTHLTKDFKAMLGMAPGVYLRRSTADGGFLLSSPPAHV